MKSLQKTSGRHGPTPQLGLVLSSSHARFKVIISGWYSGWVGDNSSSCAKAEVQASNNRAKGVKSYTIPRSWGEEAFFGCLHSSLAQFLLQLTQLHGSHSSHILLKPRKTFQSYLTEEDTEALLTVGSESIKSQCDVLSSGLTKVMKNWCQSQGHATAAPRA